MSSNEMNDLFNQIISEQDVNQTRGSFSFTDNPDVDALLKDLDNYPHAYVLACIMDKQIKAERAWTIPYKIKEIIGSFEIEDLALLSLTEYEQIFNENSLHRFNQKNALAFYLGVKKILEQYNGDASLIWADNPSSATVVYRFLEFYGVGVKIATMAANILARGYDIPMSDYYSIDISTDVHINRIMKRTGLVSNDATIEQIIYKAREMNPEYPGKIDYVAWLIGRNYCHPRKPDCEECPVTVRCLKKL